MKYHIGDTVRVSKGYRGYYIAIVKEYEGYKYLLEFSSGMEMVFHEDELEEA